MASSTISARLDESEVALLDELAAREGFDRSTLVKQLLRSGMVRTRWDSAIGAFRDGRVTLSRAAEMAGVPVIDFLGRMEGEQLELSYGEGELRADRETLDGEWAER